MSTRTKLLREGEMVGFFQPLVKPEQVYPTQPCSTEEPGLCHVFRRATHLAEYMNAIDADLRRNYLEEPRIFTSGGRDETVVADAVELLKEAGWHIRTTNNGWVGEGKGSFLIAATEEQLKTALNRNASNALAYMTKEELKEYDEREKRERQARKDAKTETENNMITTLKGFTDKKLQRHYYPEHEEWEVSECSNQIKFDMAGQAEIFIDRDEAADLAKLFADFAKHGTFRVPRNQEPSKTSNGE